MSDSGKLHTGTKGDLLLCLNDCAKAQPEPPPATAVILDGATITQMLKPGTSKICEEYALQIFTPYIVRQFQHRLDLVWDSYRADSLKSSTREKRGKGVLWRVVGSATIPGNWQSFLRVDDNKVELFRFLSNLLVQTSFHEESKELSSLMERKC